MANSPWVRPECTLGTPVLTLTCEGASQHGMRTAQRRRPAPDMAHGPWLVAANKHTHQYNLTHKYTHIITYT